MAAAKGLARLWAPWRMAYIERASAASRSAAGRRGAGAAGCLFCKVARSSADREHLVLARRPHALLMLNRFPYNPGHLMVAVRRHAGTFGALEPPEWGDLMALTALAERALAQEYRPQGMNYGANVGGVAGAGVPGHLHVHLVPRWNGDTNFMPTIAETRVMPESLARTWARLRRAVRALERPAPRRRSRRGR